MSFKFKGCSPHSRCPGSLSATTPIHQNLKERRPPTASRSQDLGESSRQPVWSKWSTATWGFPRRIHEEKVYCELVDVELYYYCSRRWYSRKSWLRLARRVTDFKFQLSRRLSRPMFRLDLLPPRVAQNVAGNGSTPHHRQKIRSRPSSVRPWWNSAPTCLSLLGIILPRC